MILLISFLIWNIKVFFHSSCPDESFKKGLWCEKDWAFNSCLINDVFPWKESWPSSEVRGLFPVSGPSKLLTHIWPKKLTKMFVNRGLIGCNVTIGNSNLEIWSDASLSSSSSSASGHNFVVKGIGWCRRHFFFTFFL